MGIADEADRTLFVGNLDPQVTEEIIFELFLQVRAEASLISVLMLMLTRLFAVSCSSICKIIRRVYDR